MSHLIGGQFECRRYDKASFRTLKLGYGWKLIIWNQPSTASLLYRKWAELINGKESLGRTQSAENGDDRVHLLAITWIVAGKNLFCLPKFKARVFYNFRHVVFADNVTV